MKKQFMLQRKSEERRLSKLNIFENEARSLGFSAIAGIDEAGRGPLAGPLFAAACMIPKGLLFFGIDDSKKLSPKKRLSLFEELTTNRDVVYSVASVSNKEIDRINIHQATIMAMLQAVAGLLQNPDYLLVDGLKLPHPTIPCKRIIRGDELSQSIAAASIIAKVSRDKVMEEYDRNWPEYGFKNHKGYGTKEHLEAIKKYGPCTFHRMTFEPLQSLSQIRRQAT